MFLTEDLPVLPAEVWAAGPLEQRGPPACGRCSGSQRRHTEALRHADAGPAARPEPSPAGSCSAENTQAKATQSRFDVAFKKWLIF